MPALDPDALARQVADPFETLREDLEDTLKEYGELDVLVELLQNALDAVDLRRYRVICGAGGLDPDAHSTIEAWNNAVLEAMAEDLGAYEQAADRGFADLAVHYEASRDDNARRRAWWERLAEHFDASADDLEAAAQTRGQVRVTVRVGPPHWIEVEDDGVGIADVLDAFQHRQSEKRLLPTRPRRLGVRGSHGWGLTAVLGFANRVEVVSRVDGGDPTAFAFSDYAAFARGDVAQPQNEELDLTSLPPDHPLSARLRDGAGIGTHVRVQLGDTSSTNVLGHSLEDFAHASFDALLRLYTPVGQVNDYISHPAFHTVRERDVTVELMSHHAGAAPIPHRKELFVDEEYPRREVFARLTRQEQKAGLFADPSRIGRRRAWDDVLSAAAVELRGHRLVRRR